MCHACVRMCVSLPRVMYAHTRLCESIPVSTCWTAVWNRARLPEASASTNTRTLTASGPWPSCLCLCLSVSVSVWVWLFVGLSFPRSWLLHNGGCQSSDQWALNLPFSSFSSVGPIDGVCVCVCVRVCVCVCVCLGHHYVTSCSGHAAWLRLGACKLRMHWISNPTAHRLSCFVAT